jgi:non-ribosomal peptide synthetase component F
VARDAAELPGLALSPLRLPADTARLDLEVTVEHGGRDLEVRAGYCTDLFDAPTVGRLLAHFQMLLQAVAAAPRLRLDELLLLTAAERQQLLWEWNDTARATPQGLLVHEMVSLQAASRSDCASSSP